MEKKRVSKKVTATILSMSLLTVMAGAAIAPALGIIKAHFSDASAMLVQFVVSMPALLIIVTNLFFMPLSRILRTRLLPPWACCSTLCRFILPAIFRVCLQTNKKNRKQNKEQHQRLSLFLNLLLFWAQDYDVFFHAEVEIPYMLLYDFNKK